MNSVLDLSSEVDAARSEGRAIVALESTIIAHGMPYPQNVETALAVEAEVRALGATPATVAILDGRLKAGLATTRSSASAAAGATSRRQAVATCRSWWLAAAPARRPLPPP